MSTISIRVSESEAKFIREYADANGLNVSSYIRNLVLDSIEDDLKLDEERILNARERAKASKKYTHEEAWNEIGV